MRYYGIPDLQVKLKNLETRDVSGDGSELTGSDTVTSEAIADIVSRWTGIPVSNLMATEKQKLLRLEKTISQAVS